MFGDAVEDAAVGVDLDVAGAVVLGAGRGAGLDVCEGPVGEGVYLDRIGSEDGDECEGLRGGYFYCVRACSLRGGCLIVV